MAVLKDASAIIAGTKGALWLPKGELQEDDPQIVQCGELFFDVVGFSAKRECYLIRVIKIDGSAEGIEDELGNSG